MLSLASGTGYHQKRGATPERALTHVASESNVSEEETVWLGPVTDEEYHSTW